jgi:hypothetical protein
VVHPASHQISRVRRYSRSPGTRLPTSSPTGLSPAAAARSSGVRLTWCGARRVSRPLPARRSSPPPAAPTGSYAGAVWAPPRSLAATQGILSVPAGTEMFQFPACPPHFRGARGCPGRVAPFGDLGITSCQRLPRAFRRVAASFVGRRRQGIHRALIFVDWVSVRLAPAADRRAARTVDARANRWIQLRCHARARIHPQRTPWNQVGTTRSALHLSMCEASRFKRSTSRSPLATTAAGDT